jgi:uroporphyrin-3 C-methyltransferase
LSEPPDKTRAPGDDDALFEERAGQRSDMRQAGSDAEEEPAADVAPAPPPARRGGRVLGALALLLALIALGGTGYLYYRLERTDPLGAVTSRLDSVENQYRQLSASIDKLSTERDKTLAEFEARQERELEAAKESLSESSREWKIAEVAYLLRIANYRLLMERDSEGALELLRAADGILAELDDFAYYQVRARLASEIRALSSLEPTDLSGVYLKLEAVKGEIANLPLKLPEYLAARRLPAPAAETDEGFWGTLATELGSYFRIRRSEREVTPLLAPDEAVYLELNLRLMLEQAQLAALRGEQVVFSESLKNAAGWLREYLDAEDPRVSDMADELNRMASITLNEKLPDISGSLSALDAVRAES